MKIIFFGSSDFSIPVLDGLLNAGHFIAKIITTPDKKRGRGQKLSASVVKEYALKHHIPVLAPEKLSLPPVATEIQELKPDFIVIASYGKLVPSSIFTAARIVSLNVHPSLLPQNRGASPIQQALLDGSKKTGVSIAEITAQLDAGDLFGQVETEIGENENALELSKRLSVMGTKLLVEVMDQLTTGNARRLPQDESKATYAKKIDRDSGHINWAQPAVVIHNQVRAYYPWPSAFTFLRGKRVKIVETRLSKSAVDKNKPGTITDLKPHQSIDIQTQTGPVEVVRLQLEAKREMNAFEFAIGQRLKRGDRFETP
ncbi:MAG: methionyl-tRNA formyltransferase [Candidatus Omnitrophica bacterium]|nr:methionyl-tRNA formyltransferase [Candidatus Omnitrophota bacterium]